MARQIVYDINSMLLVNIKRSGRPQLLSSNTWLMKCRSRHRDLKIFKIPQHKIKKRSLIEFVFNAKIIDYQ